MRYYRSVSLFCVSLFLLSFALTISTPSVFAEGREIVLSVDDENVTVDEILYLLGMQSGGGEAVASLIAKQMTPEEMNLFFEQVARALLFSKGAILRGLHLDPGVAARIRWNRINALAEAYAGSMSSSLSIEEKKLRAHYEEHRGRYRQDEKVRVRHIFTFEEEAATSALLRLLSGEDFAGVAIASSMDFATAEKGGEMGWVERGVLPKDLEDAFFSAPVNRFRGPHASTYGYHVFEILERKEERSLSFEEARDMVRGDLVENVVDAEAASLAKRFRVQMNTSVFEDAISR